MLSCKNNKSNPNAEESQREKRRMSDGELNGWRCIIMLGLGLRYDAKIFDDPKDSTSIFC